MKRPSHPKTSPTKRLRPSGATANVPPPTAAKRKIRVGDQPICPEDKKGKIRVGDQPICPDDDLRRIDAVWMPGPVPRRFWEDRHNHRNYLLWLGRRLGFRKMRDWYRITSRDIGRNHGHTPLQYYWLSYIAGIQECFWQYEWEEWLFARVPVGFWKRCEEWWRDTGVLKADAGR
jgi:hypothetical protein